MVFTTREVAIAIWLTIFAIYCLAVPKIRKSVLDAIKSACTPKLFIPFLCLLFYAVILVFLLTSLPLWKPIYLKDILLWVFFAGIPACFKATGNKIDRHYFSKTILVNLRFAALVEFIVNTFTFNIIIELLLFPAIVLLVIFDTIADTEMGSSLSKKFTSTLMILVGSIILFFSFREAIISYRTSQTIDLLVSFFIPIIFSLLYIPIAYAFVIYAKYDTLFMRMSFKEPDDRKIKRNHRIAVLTTCKLSINQITRFEQEYIPNMYLSMTSMEFDNLIKNFKSNN